MWRAHQKEYLRYLRAERGLSPATVDAYGHDIARYVAYLDHQHIAEPRLVRIDHIRQFLRLLTVEAELGTFALARAIAAIRSFHEFLELDGLAPDNPAELIDGPRIHRKLPAVLSLAEVDRIIQAADMSTDLGLRNRTMVEVLYSSGLRVSELVNLEWRHVSAEDGIVRVIGKGDKERLVPIGGSALTYLKLYRETVRNHQTAQPGEGGIVFLGRRGKRLTRHMVFQIVKQLAEAAGIAKAVSPHTFRHAFATHLIGGGADLNAVQEMLGHASITTTEIYLHMDHDFLQSVHRQFHPRH